MGSGIASAVPERSSRIGVNPPGMPIGDHVGAFPIAAICGKKLELSLRHQFGMED